MVKGKEKKAITKTERGARIKGKKITKRALVDESKVKEKQDEEGRCYFCGRKIVGLPFKCKYCGHNFCDKHRLPEDHHCIGLELRKQKVGERLAKGHRLVYEPKVKKEIHLKFKEPEPKPIRDITAPLLKSPMAIIGIVVAVIVIILFLISFLR